MCIECHMNLSNADIFNQLNTNNHNFDKYNETSINHLIIIALGFNGIKNKLLALKHLNNYKNWCYHQLQNCDENHEYINNMLNLSKYSLYSIICIDIFAIITLLISVISFILY